MNYLTLILPQIYKQSLRLACACLIAMALCVLASIISRIFGIYIPGLTEVSGYLMAATNFLALAYNFREGGHIRVDLIINNLRPKTRCVFEIFGLSVIAYISAYVTYYMARLTYFSYVYNEVSEGSIAMPLWIPQSVAVIGSLIFSISIIHTLIEKLPIKDLFLNKISIVQNPESKKKSESINRRKAQ